MTEDKISGRVKGRRLSRQAVLRLAHLARLELTEDDLEPLADQLSKILSYIEQLEAVPISPPPDSSPHDSPELTEARPSSGPPIDEPPSDEPPSDEPPRLSLTTESVLTNAPSSLLGFITVPVVTSEPPVSDGEDQPT